MVEWSTNKWLNSPLRKGQAKSEKKCVGDKIVHLPTLHHNIEKAGDHHKTKLPLLSQVWLLLPTMGENSLMIDPNEWLGRGIVEILSKHICSFKFRYGTNYNFSQWHFVVFWIIIDHYGEIWYINWMTMGLQTGKCLKTIFFWVYEQHFMYKHWSSCSDCLCSLVNKGSVFKVRHFMLDNLSEPWWCLCNLSDTLFVSPLTWRLLLSFAFSVKFPLSTLQRWPMMQFWW